jgi:hypothetical protein
MTFPTNDLQKSLTNEYKLKSKVYPLGQDVTFFGTELECYKLAYKMKSKENRVEYSENLKTWFVSFPYWFDVEFSQKIA